MPFLQDLLILHFVFSGFLGGLASALVKSKNFMEFKSFKMVRIFILGAIVGYLYYHLYSEYNFPNAVMSFCAGYSCIDFIESITMRLKPKR